MNSIKPMKATILLSLIFAITMLISASLWAATPDSHSFVIRISQASGPDWSPHTISIFKDIGSEPIHRIDLLIEFNTIDLTLSSAQIGDALKSLGWKSFVSSFESVSESGAGDSLNLLRVTASPGYDITPDTSSKLRIPDGGEIIKLKFYSHYRRALNCYLTPIRFCWRTCEDNALTSTNYDSLFSVSRVIDFEAIKGEANEVLVQKEITGEDANELLAIGGKFSDWEDPEARSCCRSEVVFIDGGIEIGCLSIDAYGDLNLNGIVDRQDLVLLAKAIEHGVEVLPKLGREGAIAASDVNHDGILLTIADLMALDELFRLSINWTENSDDYRDSTRLALSDTLLWISSLVPVDDICAIIVCDSNSRITNLSRFDMVRQYDTVNQRLMLLLFTDSDSAGAHDPLIGNRKLISLPRGSKLIDAQATDTSGSQMVMYMNNSAFPTRFGTSVRPSNPADSTVAITLLLPEPLDWMMLMHSWSGQVYDFRSGNDSGIVTVNWDATNLKKGDYRLTAIAGGHTFTRSVKIP